MPTLRIDNQTLTVEPGTTLLQAATRLGIRIPTLCHLEELKPATACLVCLVSIQGQDTLVPSCGALAEEGMVVATDTEDVRRARTTALSLLLSEHTGDCLAPCHLACPQGINIPAMIRAIQKNDFNQALGVIAQATDPWDPALCEDCRKPCESVCRRKAKDEAIAIAQLIQATQAHADHRAAQDILSPARSKKETSCSSIRKITPDEIEAFCQGASLEPRTRPQDAGQRFSPEEAVQESLRCLHCDCRKQQKCALREQADQHQARQITFAGERAPYTQRVFKTYLYEPGKCIQCGICTRICEKAGVPSGFTLMQRGFETQMDVPFGRFENAELNAVLPDCIEKCPTGALCWKDQDATGMRPLRAERDETEC